MVKDNRYNIARIFIEKGEIKTIAQIFDYIPKSVVSPEIKTNNNRFTRLINDPLEFKLIELSKIAKAIGIETKVLVNMALRKRTGGPDRRKKQAGNSYRCIYIISMETKIIRNELMFVPCKQKKYGMVFFKN